MNKARSFFIKFLLVLIFLPLAVGYFIQLVEAFVQVLGNVISSMLPVVIQSICVLTIVAVFMWCIARWLSPHRARFGRKRTELPTLGNAAIRRPRGKKQRRDNDD